MGRCLESFDEKLTSWPLRMDAHADLRQRPRISAQICLVPFSRDATYMMMNRL